MRALRRKLLRDVLRMWPQLLAAAAVMSCGVATLVMSISAIRSLETARDAYYERYRFPDVFAHLKRAPDSLGARIAEIDGVARVRTRVAVDVNLDVPGMSEPATGRLVSIPDNAPFGLSELHLRHGRMPSPDAPGEALASEPFAEAHGMRPGATLRAVINGRLDELTVVGVALSPEHVYQVRPGEVLPDDRRYGVLWMPERQLAPAFDMDGAFNDVILALSPTANEPAVIAALDRMTEEYGGAGAYGRRDQESDRFLRNELDELRTMSVLPPSIFLSATAFILAIVFSRVVRSQREQVATLRAFGYGRWTIAGHYLGMAFAVAVVGCVAGVAMGAAFGASVTDMYARFFRFPRFDFVLDGQGVLIGLMVGSGAAVAGVIGAALRAAALAPAEAMRPESPPDYRATMLERIGVHRLLGPAGRMALRRIERQPVRSALSCLGIGLAGAVLIVGGFAQGSVDEIMHFAFSVTQRQSATVTFVEPASPDAAHELKRLPGVLRSEPFRAVPARLRAGHRSRLQGVVGLPAGSALARVVDRDERPILLHGDGLVVTEILADLLDVREGDPIVIEVLEGQRPVLETTIARVAKGYVGTEAYMEIDALRRQLDEGAVVSGAHLDVDEAREEELYAWLKGAPRIAGVTIKAAALESFHDTIAENILRMRLFNMIFATVIAFGVVYNTARVAFAERAHELATLRVLGFTRTEASVVLLGELAALTVVAIPVGLLMGRGLAAFIASALGGETIRMPAQVNASTYVFAATVVAFATAVSGLVVRRRVDRLDLVEVLKTKG